MYIFRIVTWKSCKLHHKFRFSLIVKMETKIDNALARVISMMRITISVAQLHFIWFILFCFVFIDLFAAIKKPTNIGTQRSNSCPVCGDQLLANELETHFLAELDQLYKLSTGQERQRIRASYNMNSAMHLNNGLIQGPDSRWEVMQNETKTNT